MQATYKELQRGGDGFYLELGMMHVYFQELKGEMEGLEQLNNDYADLFQDNIGFPPHRRCDHVIEVKYGFQIPNIHLCTYPLH